MLIRFLTSGLQKCSVVQQVPRALWTGRGCHPYRLTLAAHLLFETEIVVSSAVHCAAKLTCPTPKAQSTKHKAQSTKHKTKTKIAKTIAKNKKAKTKTKMKQNKNMITLIEIE